MTQNRNDTPAATLLSLKNISVSLAKRQILRDVTLEIDKGEFYGLIGSNGAGKTTLLRLILGLLKQDSGQIEIRQQDAFTGQRLIGYVPQKIDFDRDIPLRARDLVGLGIDGHKFGISLSNKKKREQVDDILRSVNAFEFADAKIGALSGGQQQKIMIAHALVGNPSILLLDEPLANLDLKSQHEVIALVNKLKIENNISILFSAHDMNPLLDVMDKIVYIANGKIAVGKVSEIINSETLTNLYGYPVDVLTYRNRLIVLTGNETEGLHHELSQDGIAML